MELEKWLKESIWGLIVLGALGSVISYVLILLVRKFINYIKYGKEVFKEREFRLGQNVGFTVGLSTTDNKPLVVYLIYKIVLLQIYLFVLAASFYVLLTIIINTNSLVLSLGSFISITLFFLFLRLIYEQYREVRTFYNLYIITPIEEAKKKVSKNKNTANLRLSPTASSNRS